MRRNIFIGIIVLLLASCQEGPFYEKNSVIPGQLWDNGFKPEFQVEVKEKQSRYDLFFNLRHTAYYPYTSFSFQVNQRGKSVQDSSLRYEFKLAEPDGSWTGKSAGNIYEQSQLIKENMLFPDTGIYVFSIQQNMNDNPLRGINDVGIKLIKK